MTVKFHSDRDWKLPWKVAYGEGCPDPVLVDAEGEVLTLASCSADISEREELLAFIAERVNRK